MAFLRFGGQVSSEFLGAVRHTPLAIASQFEHADADGSTTIRSCPRFLPGLLLDFPMLHFNYEFTSKGSIKRVGNLFNTLS